MGAGRLQAAGSFSGKPFAAPGVGVGSEKLKGNND